jgi:pyruvyl transferase EpsO
LLVLERYITAREGGTQARTALAQHRLARGLEILASGRHVVTDRLHGHILSLLLSVPHFVLDNSYNKNGAFFETWISGYANATFGDSIGAFVAWADARGLGGLVAAARDTVGTVVA